MIIAVSARSLIPVFLAVVTAACSSSPASKAAPSPAPFPEKIPASPADPRPVIAAFGDSLSAGYGLAPSESYPARLQRLLDNAGYSYHVVNMGVSGDTTTDGLVRLPDVIALHPQIVILEFGGNDGLRGQPAGATRDNLAAIIEALQKAGSTVILAGITLPRNYGPDYIRQFDAVFVDLSRRFNLVRIPFLLEGVGGNAALTQLDGLHPTAEGAAIVAQTVMKYLKPLLR